MVSKYALTAALVLGASVSTASAATLSVIGGAATPLPANFSLFSSPVYMANSGGVGDVGDIISVFTQATKAVGNGLSVDGAGSATFTFLGSEAGFENTAVVFGSDFVSNQVDVAGAVSAPFAFTAGFLPISFVSLGVNSIANDGVANSGVQIAFSSVFNGGNSILAFFDDTDPDVDYDDLVVRIDIVSEVSEVPLPAAGWLLGAALAGVGFLGRKRVAA